MKNTRSAAIRLGLFSMMLLLTLQFSIFATTATVFAARVNSDPSLPPRPPLTTPSPKQGTSRAERPRTARIELTVTNAEPGSWSVVQWRDGNGNWQDVEGWRAPVGSEPIIWWVLDKDFGKGPFRWVIYRLDGDFVLPTSELFYLPRAAGEVVLIRL